MAYMSMVHPVLTLNNWLWTTILLYRAFNKLFHDPLGAAFESLILLYDKDLFVLFIAAFVVNKTFTLCRKLMYVLVSFLTAMTNKKQRFNNQGICFALQLTIALPLLLGVVLISTLLDTATIPFLGFAFFTIGYPKPLRGWSSINPLSANPNDSRSDGHIYEATMGQLSDELQKLISCDPFNFGVGSFYFLKNEKMIILVHVLERGNNFVVVSVKGTELQETTVCHAEENENINSLTESWFDRKEKSPQLSFSLSPVKQINFSIYDDVKNSLTGIIENPEFESMVKKAFYRIAFMQLRGMFRSHPTHRLFQIFNSPISDRERRAADSHLCEKQWLNFLDYDFYNHEFSKLE
jgi:hypothetical protein